MSNKFPVLRVIGYAFGASLLASLIVLLVGLCVFGFQFAQWAESQGRIVGGLGTIAGIAGAVIGLQIALRAERRATG